jgi:hypothetical protein
MPAAVAAVHIIKIILQAEVRAEAVQAVEAQTQEAQIRLLELQIAVVEAVADMQTLTTQDQTEQMAVQEL